MEVIILINCGMMNLTMLEQCRTRSEYFAFMLKKEMSLIEGVNPTIIKSYPMIKIRKTFRNIFVNNIKNADHIVFIDEYGFYNKDKTFLQHLKLISHYSVTSLCKHFKYYGGEDLMFTYTKYANKDKLYQIKTPLDPEINRPMKVNNVIYILISKPASEIRNYNIDETIKILSKINDLATNNPSVEFKIALICSHSIDYIETDGNITNSVEFNSYYDYITEINKATMYFQLIQIDDIYRLYELSMSDTLIITTGIFIDMMIIKELNIFKYNKDFSWNDIFSKINSNNIRQKLIDENYTWKNLANLMIEKMREFKIEYDNHDDNKVQNESSIRKEFYKPKVGYYLNTDNKKQVNRSKELKQTSNITNNRSISSVSSNSTKKKKKIPVLLQSSLK